MSIPGPNYPKVQFPGKFPSIFTSSDLSVNPSGNPLFTPSPSAENPLKIPGNHGGKTAVTYLHEIQAKISTVYTSSVMSVIGPVGVLSIPSIHPSDNKHQEIPVKFPSTNCGEKYLVEIMVKIPSEIHLYIDFTSFHVTCTIRLHEGLSVTCHDCNCDSCMIAMTS